MVKVAEMHQLSIEHLTAGYDVFQLTPIHSVANYQVDWRDKILTLIAL